MPKTFKIYFKEGKIIPVTIEKFQLEEGEIVLYDEYGHKLRNYFVLFEEISAIVSDNFEPYKEAKQFNIYLRNLKEPITILAFNFSYNDSQQIVFNDKDYWNGIAPVENLYVSPSEILAVFPIDK